MKEGYGKKVHRKSEQNFQVMARSKCPRPGTMSGSRALSFLYRVVRVCFDGYLNRRSELEANFLTLFIHQSIGISGNFLLSATSDRKHISNCY